MQLPLQDPESNYNETHSKTTGSPAGNTENTEAQENIPTEEKTMKNRLTSFGYILKRTGLDENTYTDLQRHGQDLESIYNSALARAERINESEELTSQGKAKRKSRLTEEIETELNKFQRIATQAMQFQQGPSYQLEIDQLRERLQHRPSDQDPVLTFLQEQEIRNYLRAIKEPLQIETLVRQHAEAGDFTFLDAVIHAPEGSEKFILPKTQQDLQARRLIKQNPEIAQRLEQLETAQLRLLGMIQSVKNSLKKQELFREPDKDIEFLDAS